MLDELGFEHAAGHCDLSNIFEKKNKVLFHDGQNLSHTKLDHI